MKKTGRWIAIGCAAAMCIGAAAFLAGRGERPFRDLDAAQIASAQVQLLPPDRTVEIADTAELAALLQAAVVYEQDDSYTEYAGQAVIITLTMADGAQREIMAYNPFLVIDGVGYRTKYAPCEALNGYANGLLTDGTAGEKLQKPPELNIVLGDTAWSAQRNGYSWTRDCGNGEMATTIADAAHPLDCEALLSPAVETTEKTAQLHFASMPDAIAQVCCWSDAHWGDTAAESEPVELTGNTLTLKPGGYIYRITARWDKKYGCGGTAEYVVYIRFDEG